MARGDPARRRAAWIAAGVVAVLVLVQQAVYRGAVSPRERSDYPVYEAAGRAFLAGEDVYAVVSERGWAFNGLPILAAATAPFSLLGRPLGLALFTLVSLAAFALAARSWMRLFPAERRRAALAGFLLTAAGPLLSAAVRGQPSVAGLSAAVLGLAAFAAGRARAAAIGFAAATAVKLFPVGYAALTVFADRGRTARLTGAVLVALLLLPAAVHGIDRNFLWLRRCVEVSTPPATRAQADPQRYEHTLDPRLSRNQSLEAVLLRNFCDDGDLDRGDGRAPAVRVAARGVAALWLLIAAVLGRRAARQGRTVEAAALWATPLVVACPVAWSHYFLVAAPVGAVAGALLGSPKARFPAALSLCCGILVPALGHALPWLKFAGITMLGSTAAWIFLLAALGRDRRGDAADVMTLP
jgi:alpha-1,2-mannosyltransferase